MSIRHASLVLVCTLACSSSDETQSSSSSSGSSSSGPSCTPAAETCDGADEDCDGVADDGPCSEPKAAGALFLGGSGTDHVRGVAFDAEGNVYLTGAVTVPADFGAGPVEGVSAYVASFDPAGNLRWSYLWGGTSGGHDYGQDVSVAGGLVCASGSFTGPFDFGGGVRPTVGYSDAVVLCLDAADGAYRWDRAFGGDLSDVVEGVRVAPSGDVVATGSIESGSADFGGGPMADPRYFVVRYGPAGEYRWARAFGEAGADFGASPAVDAAGNVYAVGRFNGVVDFGGGPRTPAESAAAFLVALDGDGAYLWDRPFDAPGHHTLYGVVARGRGDVVICGEFGGTLSIGGEPVQLGSERSTNAFAAAFDATGAFVWQYAAGGTAGTRGFGCAVGPDDEVVLAAAFAGTTTFGDIARTSAGEDDMYAVGLTPEGKYLWDVTLGGVGQDAVNAVAIDGAGRAALGGESWGDLTLGSETHANVGGADGSLVFLE